ncbi:MAG: hypothetical protein WAS07_06420, partial [Micropruina sp.]
IGTGGSRVAVVIGGTAHLVGETVTLLADTSIDAYAYGESDSDAVGADSDARADAIARGVNEVVLGSLAQVTGDASVTFTATFSKIKVNAVSDSSCSCLGGDTDSEANDDAQVTTKVTGVKDALIRTALLYVNSLAPDVSVTRDRRKSGGLFDGGSRGGSETKDVKRHIDWESTTILLGEPNPKLHIAADGTVTELRNITGTGGNGNPLTLGQNVGTGLIIVDDIEYNSGGNVFFTATELPGHVEVGQIWGNAAIFDFQETWDYVEIINASPNDIQINLIDVVKPPSSNTITVNVANVPNGTFSFRVDNVSLGQTFHFELIHSYIGTLVTIANDQTSGTDWDVFLNDLIENPIGTTIVRAMHGDIENSAGVAQLIRTNVLDLDAPLGSIGTHTSPSSARVPLNIELIESDYTDNGAPIDPINDPYRRTANGTYTAGKPIITRMIVVTADAGDDVVLTVAAHRAADDARRALHQFVITFGPINAGDDIDLLVLNSYDRDNPGGPGAVNVVRTANGANFVPTTYNRFFRPDCTPLGLSAPCLSYELGTSATGTAAVMGRYLFATSADNYIGLGGTIEIGDRPLGVTPYLNAGDFISVRHLDNGQISYTGIVNADSDGNGTGSSVLLTNAFINAEERVGDFRVDQIASSGSDVTLWALGRIIDAENDPVSFTVPDPIVAFTMATPTTGTDVRGVNITMTAGLGGVTGGIGTAANWLEIDVDVLDGAPLGVLNAFDTAVGDTTETEGIFLYETDGTLQVDTVDTLSDVALRTVNGSIVDARNGGLGDDDWNIRGRSIDLDANGGSIGNPNGLNDLEIDSSRSGPFTSNDVGLEASASIYLTETDHFLRLVLAHAEDGNIRLTVRESAAFTDEDLYLIETGTVLFTELGGPDDPRNIPIGTIFANGVPAVAAGNVRLQVGDDIDTHANSRIFATRNIDIFGDWLNLDLNFGSTMVFRGDITANYLGLAANSPPFLTNIWGDTDVDTIQFGDPTGIGMTNTLGSPGYIHLGSQTRVHGSEDLDSTGDDGEDRITVYFLQTMNVAAGHTLTLDGQADTDYYKIFTTGSRAIATGIRDYVINILDTGAANDGVDEGVIVGIDNTNPAFNGYVAGSLTQRAPNDDVFLLRASTCIPADGGFDCTGTNETADRPGFVALLHGSVGAYADIVANNEPSTLVQRVNYDRALNGRLSVYGLGGNDHFYVDDTTATITLDGGAGFDTFQIGQIFGTKRDLASGGVRPQDLFPDLIPTTRGWLSPGTHAPLVATGGTGNDEFTVYSNQAELRLEGDDGSDLFVVRAFALAAVCDTSTDADSDCDYADLTIARAANGLYPRDVNGNGFCTSGEGGYTGVTRNDNDLDGDCDLADANRTPTWTDDIIPLDANGVATPRIGAGFSTGRPLDIRTGGGDDEVQYNVNAPVSVEGGTGIDKLVVLGTEFADDIVITAAGIYGAGLNVRYSTVEIIEVDGLEGDDEFFVQSTAFGVAYRVIGGLGSDTINVTGDIVEDIVVRELEGISGYVNHLVTSDSDVGYDGLPTDGVETNVVRGEVGLVVIEETNGFTAVREGGPVQVDAYSIKLAKLPTANVYVTISAARSPQEEADDAASINAANLAQNLATGRGDTVWLCTGASAAACDDPTEFRRYVWVNGVLTAEDNRSLVLTFTAGNYSAPQWVYVYAVDEFADSVLGTPNSEVDPRSEGDRVHVLQHTVLSADARYDGLAVRNVEVQLRDNDTPGVYVTEVEPGTSVEDGRTLVIEGKNDPAVGGAYTGLNDEVLVQLAMDPGAGVTIVVKLNLDLDSAAAISLYSADPRWDAVAQTITFTGGALGNWDDAVRLLVKARDDFRREDPQVAVVGFACFSAISCGTSSAYRIPNLRSGTGLLDVEVIDDETPDLVTIETGGSTIVIDDDPATGIDESTLPTSQDSYTIRLTKRPDGTVVVAILTDGLTDVVSINGVPVVLTTIGGYVPSRLFLGKATISGTTITRAAGDDLGSFLEEGFRVGQFIRIAVNAAAYDRYITAINLAGTVITLDAAGVPAALAGSDVMISRLTRVGLWTGNVLTAADPEPADPSGLGGRRITRTDNSSWLRDGFLEGQRVRVTNVANPLQFVDLKIAVIRGTNTLKDETLQFTAEGATPAWWLTATAVTVNRLAAVATFTPTTWYLQQTVVLKADPLFALPLVRQGAKIFPNSKHLLSRLRGPLAVEGGVTGADRSLRNGVKLPGELDGPLFAIAAQAPESRQIDVLNIFNDSSQADGSGVMTSTTLTGFGLAKQLCFADANPFGEPACFPGGISFGAIAFDGTQFVTDGGQSTLEVVNLLLGIGNDTLDIQGTLDPAPAVSATGDFDYAGNGIIRTGPVTWQEFGFLVGQQITIPGVGVRTITGFSTDGLTMFVSGAPLAGVPGGVQQLLATDPDVSGTGTA